MDKSVTLRELAEEFCLNRSHLRKYVQEKTSIRPFKIRTHQSGNQLTLAVSPEDADRIRNQRAEYGFGNTKPVQEIPHGVFYMIAADPEMRPNRIKMGFTDSIPARTQAYRTIAPLTTLIASWPCRREWEATAIAAVASTVSTNHVYGETYDFKSQEAAIEVANELFALLPDAENQG